MYTLFVSLAVSVVAFVLTAVFLDPVAGIVPAVFAFGLVLVVVLLQVKKRVDAEMQGLTPILQRQNIEQGKQHLENIRVRWGNWMPLLSGQIDAQLGMIEYFRLKFDEALPLLEKGSGYTRFDRNWMALVCIGAIHYRKGRKDKAWEALDRATAAAGQEAMAYIVYAVLLTRAGERERALQVLNAGLKAAPESKKLIDLKAVIANKKKIKTTKFGQSWFQYFPEDLAQQQMAAGRGGPMPGMGFKGPKVSKQVRRGR